MLAGVYGGMWRDANWNAQWDDGENAQSARLVYVDENQNGLLDADEKSDTTDDNGYFEIADLSVGEHTVRQLLPSGWGQSWPVDGDGAHIVTLETDSSWEEIYFGGYQLAGGIYGWVFDDANVDGAWDDTETGLENWTVYIDANENGSLDDDEQNAVTDSDGYYEFAGLLPGDYTLAQVVPEGWAQSWPGTETQTATITTDTLWAETYFGDYELTGGIYGWLFNDSNADGAWDDTELGLEKWTVYIDANENGSLDDDEADAITDSDGYYEFAGLLPGDYTLAQIVPDGWAQSWPGTETQTATITTDTLWAETYFGDYELTGGIYGWVFDDANVDGAWDDTETGLENWTVYIDVNENGSLDDDEADAITDSDGYYEFAGLLPGDYTLAQIVPDGWAQSWPGTETQTATITTDTLWAETYFGDYELTGGIYGWVFDDANADGAWDDGESGLEGRTVYVDTNGDGALDDDELTAVTNFDGYYEFAGLLPGDYLLTQVIPDGWEQTWPTTSVQTATITTDSLWAETYLGCAESYEIVAQDIGIIDFAKLEAVEPGAGELWFRLETSRDAWLTILAADEWSDDQLSLQLYEPSDLTSPVATSSSTDDVPRLDHEAGGGQEYLLRVTGTASETDLLIANLVHDENGAVSVHGTDQDDTFIFSATASRAITTNGIGYQYQDSELSTVTFDAGAGTDTVWFYDSSGDESLEAWPDRVVLMNASGDSVSDFSAEAKGFEVLLAYAKAGGTDSAVLHGSENSDKLKSYEEFALLRAKDSSYALRAKLFDSVIADSGEAGKDIAVYTGAEGSETFTFNGSQNTARLRSTGRDHYAQGFDSILARAEGSERDVAYFTDLPGPDDQTDDVFYFRGQKTQLVNSSIEVTVRAFDEVHATASESGFDVARMYDTSGNEYLTVDGDTVRLYRRDGNALDLLYEAVAFEALKAYSTEGDDSAEINETDMILLLYGWDE